MKRFINPFRSFSAGILPFVFLMSLLNSACKKDSSLTRTPIPMGPGPSAFLLPPLHFFAWTQLANLPFTDEIKGDKPMGLASPLSFSINGKGYLCGGLTYTSGSAPEYLNKLWEFDTATKAWTQKANFPGLTRDDGTAFVIGNDAYILVSNNLWQYNQLTDTWTAKSNLPGNARGNASSFVVDGEGYVGAGHNIYNIQADLSDFWQYNPATDTWMQKPGLPAAPRESAASFAIGSNGFICGGINISGAGTTYLTDLWEYDAVFNRWVQHPNFPATGRGGAVGFSAQGYGFVATGADSSGFFNDCWKYNDSTGQWSNFPNVGGNPRFEAGGFAIGNNLYIAAGITSGGLALNDFWTLNLGD